MSRKKVYSQQARAEIKRRKADLDRTLEQINNLPNTKIPEEMVAKLYGYLTVRTCGLLEKALFLAASSLCETQSHGETKRFVLAKLEKGFNPKTERIIEFVEAFNLDWASELRLYLSKDLRDQNINALVGNRNSIAHGENQGVSRKRVIENIQLVYELIDWILEKFEPVPKG
jgi:hypothetical protein